MAVPDGSCFARQELTRVRDLFHSRTRLAMGWCARVYARHRDARLTVRRRGRSTPHAVFDVDGSGRIDYREMNRYARAR